MPDTDPPPPDDPVPTDTPVPQDSPVPPDVPASSPHRTGRRSAERGSAPDRRRAAHHGDVWISAEPSRASRRVPVAVGWSAASARRVLRALAVAVAVAVTALAMVPPEGRATAAVRGGPRAVEPVAVAEPAPPGAGPPGGGTVAPPARPPGAGLRAPGADYAWPLLPAPAVVTPFRRPSFRFGRGHRGADLLGTPGQAVLVAGPGTVVFAGSVAGRPLVSVDHPDGLRTTYEPVVATVRAGDRVAAGDPLGVLVAGHAGCTGAACLHWGVRRGRTDYLDPLVLVRPQHLRLLPWDGVAGPATALPGG